MSEVMRPRLGATATMPMIRCLFALLVKLVNGEMLGGTGHTGHRNLQKPDNREPVCIVRQKAY